MAAMAVEVSRSSRVDGSLSGHDGSDSADGAADGEQAGELGAQAEDAAEQHHDGEREDELDGDEDEREAAEVEEVAEHELCADENDAEFEPELVGGEAGAEECGEADGVADGEAEQDGPEHVLDLREGDVTGAQVVAEGLDSLACETDAEEQRGAGDEREELTPERALARGVQRQRDGPSGGQDDCARLPADVRDDVEADECGERKRDDDGGSVDVEGQLGRLAGEGTRVHEVLLLWMW